jgi:hypothetical protein
MCRCLYGKSCQKVQTTLKGVSKITCGILSCPVVCVSSCMLGSTMFLAECTHCCRCFNDDIVKEREKVCYYCGIGTSIDVSIYLCRRGYEDIKVEYEMIR